MAFLPPGKLGNTTLQDYGPFPGQVVMEGPSPFRTFTDNRWEEPDDQIGRIINALPLPFKECPNCDRPLKPLMRGQIRMEPTKEPDSLYSGRAVICSECKHFITQEYAPVNEKWVYENLEHPFSKCVRMAMAHPVLPPYYGCHYEIAKNTTYAICGILQEVVAGWPSGPIHPELEEFKEVSEGVFAALVKRRMVQKEIKREAEIGRMDTVRFAQTMMAKDLYKSILREVCWGENPPEEPVLTKVEFKDYGRSVVFGSDPKS